VRQVADEGRVGDAGHSNEDRLADQRVGALDDARRVAAGLAVS